MKKVLIIAILATTFMAGLDQPDPLLSGGRKVNAMLRATILVYDSPESAIPLWAGTTDGTLPSLRLEGGMIANMDEMIPSYLEGELWIEIVRDGEKLTEDRLRYNTDRAELRRDTDPDSPAETLDEFELNIGQVGGTAHIRSDVGIGTDSPEADLDVNGDMILGSGVSVDKILDEDDMASDDALALATQQSIKAYVDAHGGTVEEAVLSISSEANRTGRYGHMMFVPTESSEITESDPAHNDTIYIAIRQESAMACSSPPPSPTTIYGPSEVCALSEDIAYSVPPVSGASYYIWTLPAGAYITSGSGSNAVSVRFGSTPGNIEVEAMNPCGTSAPASMTITMGEAPVTPSMISGEEIVASGGTGLVYSISPVAGAESYSWTLPPGAFITSGAGTESITVTFGISGGNVCVASVNDCGESFPICLSIVTVEPPFEYDYTGYQQTFDIPAGLSEISVECWGAQGGNSGGYGGYAKGVLNVAGITELYIFPGGTNGYNGGGAGSTPAHNGGGMSDVRVGGTTVSDQIIVAGGGGGQGNNGPGGAGGGGAACSEGAGGQGGGGYSGADGSDGTCTTGGAGGTSGHGSGGGGGGLTSGGGGGISTSYPDGTAGTRGLGGNWGNNSSCYAGGGGGGYYGGGGSPEGNCSGGSGGGGSSWANSALMSELEFTGGIWTGDGKVVIDW